MQQLQGKFKNTPRNAPLVPCSVSLVLNKVERLSVQDKVLTCNNPEVDQSRRTGSKDLRVPCIVYAKLNKGEKSPLFS